LGEYAVEGKAIGAYGMKLDNFWNPKNAAYNVFEFGANEASDEVVRGAEFVVQIPPEQVGEPQVIYAVAGTWGQPGKLSVVGPDGQMVLEKETHQPFSGELLVFNFTPARAGQHVIRYLQPYKGVKGGRISQTIYVLPVGKTFPPLPTAP
jgi:hypothetical protein